MACHLVSCWFSPTNLHLPVGASNESASQCLQHSHLLLVEGVVRWLSWKSVRLTYKRQWVPSPAEALEFYPEVNICTGPFRYLRRPDIKMPTSNDHLTAFHQSFWWLCQCTKFSVRMLGNIFLPLSQSQFRFSGCVEDDSRLVCIASLWEARYPALPGLAEGYI